MRQLRTLLAGVVTAAAVLFGATFVVTAPADAAGTTCLSPTVTGSITSTTMLDGSHGLKLTASGSVAGTNCPSSSYHWSVGIYSESTGGYSTFSGAAIMSTSNPGTSIPFRDISFSAPAGQGHMTLTVSTSYKNPFTGQWTTNSDNDQELFLTVPTSSYNTNYQPSFPPGSGCHLTGQWC